MFGSVAKPIAQYPALLREATDLDVALHGVEKEVSRQVELWGEQTHPLRIEQYDDSSLNYLYRAEDWKTRNAHRVADGTLTWSGILLEEVYEALSAENDDDTCEELEQVAAVAISMILDLKRRKDVTHDVL